LTAQYGYQALWLARRAHDHRKIASTLRAKVEIDERRRLFAETEVLAVSHHADDVGPRTGSALRTESFVERRLARPEAARKSFVDHGCARSSNTVLFVEVAAFEQVHAQRSHEAGRRT